MAAVVTLLSLPMIFHVLGEVTAGRLPHRLMLLPPLVTAGLLI